MITAYVIQKKCTGKDFFILKCIFRCHVVNKIQVATKMEHIS